MHSACVKTLVVVDNKKETGYDAYVTRIELERKCGKEFEKMGLAYAGEHFDGDISKMMAAHDKGADGHVHLEDLRNVFTKAGVSEECVNVQTETALKVMVNNFDHDENGEVHHSELQEKKSERKKRLQSMEL